MSRRLATFSVLALAQTAGLAVAAAPDVQVLGPLPGETQIGPAVNSQVDQSVARGGSQALVVWGDMRARSVSSQAVQSDSDILGIRIDSSGAPIDAVPFLIAGGMGMQDRPLAAWNGTNWLVVYRSQDPVGQYYGTQLRAVRVSPAGEVLDPTPILLPPTEYSPGDIGLQVAGLNGQWLITRCVYYSTGYGTFLAGQRIGGDGQVLDVQPRNLMDWTYGQTQLLVSDGEYLVAGPDWTNSSTTKARRVSAAAQPVGPAFNLPGPYIGAGQGEYYVAWISNFTDLVGSRMSAAGVLANPAGTVLAPGLAAPGHVNLTHDGQQWWAAWGVAPSEIRTMRLTPAGVPIDPLGGVALPIAITGSISSAYGVQLATRPEGGVQVLWGDHRAALGSDANVFTMPVSAANIAGQERCVSTSTANQRSVELAAGPAGGSAAAYISELANSRRVVLHLLDAADQPTTPEPILVAQAPTIARCGVAFNGSAYMVVWDEGASGMSTVQIKARRFTATGQPIDPAPFDVMAGFHPAVGALGEDFLVVAARFGITPQYIDLFGRRYSGSTGTPIDPGPIYLNAGLYVSGHARVRSDGSRWLVATHTMWTHNSSQGDAVLVRVPPTGTPQPGFNPTTIAGGSGDPDIAFSGSNYLVAWRNNSLSNANNYIAGRIMNLDGTYATGAFVIAEAAGRQLRPTVAWDGSTYIVAWDDQRNQQAFFDARTDVYATRVSLAGEVLDPSGFALIATPQGDAGVSLLARPGRSTLAAASTFVVQPPVDSYRVNLVRLAGACAANCDGSTVQPVLTPADFVCFLNKFRAGDPYANCDGSTGTPTLTPADFVCFLNKFRAGCT